MKPLALLVVAGLSGEIFSFEPLPPPSRLPTTERNFLMDIALDGHRKFVAVGEGGTHLRMNRFYQDYMGAWTVEANRPDGGDAMDPLYYGVARSKTRFVAVGQHNLQYKDASRAFPVISRSDDAMAWTAQNGPAKGALWGVATDGDSRWVAVGTQQILSSEDGATTWDLALEGTGGETRAVSRGATEWMAATLLADRKGTRFHTSGDGRAWTETSDVPGVQVSSLVEGDGIWIAVGRYQVFSSRACILRSTDRGATWTEVGPTLQGPDLRDATWGTKTGFVAVGTEGAKATVLWSRDGAVWQSVHRTFGGSIRAVQIFESPTPEGPEGTSEIVMVGDTGAIWLDTLTFDTRRGTAGVYAKIRPEGAWKQVADRLEAPAWVQGSVEVAVLGMDGRLESARVVYLGASRSIELPLFWGSRILRVRDASGMEHTQRLGPTARLF